MYDEAGEFGPLLLVCGLGLRFDIHTDLLAFYRVPIKYLLLRKGANRVFGALPTRIYVPINGSKSVPENDIGAL